MSFEIMAPLMFAVMLLALLIGYPVAFTLGAVGLIFGWVGVQLDFIKPVFLENIPLRIFDTMKSQVLLAIPFFTFMGFILERSGMAEDLLETMGQLLGRLKGGIAYAVILVGALLGGPAGVVAASVISMGLISLPVMMRYGYSHRLSAGVITSSGTLAQIIPPALVLIVMADQLGVSVGDMYRGSLWPSLILVALYMIYVWLVTLVRPKMAPALPADILERRGRNQPFQPQLIQHGLFAGALLLLLVLFGRGLNSLNFWLAILSVVLTAGIGLWVRRSVGEVLSRRVLVALLPALALIFLVLGTIFFGIATPTEGAAMGAVGSLILAALRRSLNWKIVIQAMEGTARLTAFVLFILVGSRIFSLVFVGLDGDLWIQGFLKDLPGGEFGFLIAVNIFVFVFAFFLDYFEIAFIIIPLIGPAAAALGIDLYWFGVILSINLLTSFKHPPFGFALFYLRSVAPPSLKTIDIYWGAVPFIVIDLIMVMIVIFMPWLVTNFITK